MLLVALLDEAGGVTVLQETSPPMQPLVCGLEVEQFWGMQSHAVPLVMSLRKWLTFKRMAIESCIFLPGKSFETTLAKDLTDGICQFIRCFNPGSLVMRSYKNWHI